MGKALEWLGADGCRQLATELLTGICERNGELWSHCPWHSEKTPGGAFSYDPVCDIARCFSCGGSGDLITIFCGVNGYPLEGSAGFLEFRKLYAPDFDSAIKPLATEPKAPRGFQPNTPAAAPVKWHKKAAQFVEHSIERLANEKSVLSELADLGFSRKTITACKFGWNDRDKAVPRSSWGLASEKNIDTGKEKKIWLPKGLVLPMLENGKVVKLKIRRSEAKTSWGANLRYWEVPGGENGRYHIYGKKDCKIWVVVETERDAALVWQEVGRFKIGAMGLGGATKRPVSGIYEILQQADLILLALDTDLAGAENVWKFWVGEFPTAIRWCVPASMGKDIGEAVKNHNLDVKAWLWSGLPKHIQDSLTRSLKRQKSVQGDLQAAAKIQSEDAALESELAELVAILRQYPIRIHINACQCVADKNWLNEKKENWQIWKRAAFLFQTKPVLDFLDSCYKKTDILSGANCDLFLKTWWKMNAPAVAEVTGKVKSLFQCLSSGPIKIRKEDLFLEYSFDWGRKKKNWDILCRISNELVFEDSVYSWLKTHPDEMISAGNFWSRQ